MMLEERQHNTEKQNGRWSGGCEKEFRPHVRHVEPVLTECDLDWKSRLRWIPEPRYSDAPFPEIKAIKFPGETKLMRPFPQANMASQSEWTFYPNFGQTVTYHVGKRSFTDKLQHGSTLEYTLESTIGRKRHVKPTCHLDLGSRPFLCPEYSPDFHKLGSTLPKASFGFSPNKADTFIPLQPLPEKPYKPYSEKRKMLEKEQEILQVQNLSKWRPTPSIFQNYF